MKMILISDGSDLVGVTRIHDIVYMRYLRSAMRQLGAWPGHLIGEPKGYRTQYKIYLDLNTTLLLIAGLLYIRNNFSRLSFEDMALNYITMFVATLICFVRCMTIRKNKYNELFRYFIKEIHLFNVRNASPYAMKTHLYVHKYSHAFTLYMRGAVFVAIICFNLIPLINTSLNGGFSFPPPENVTYETSVNYAFPFDYEHNFNGFILVTLLNWYETYLASAYFCIIDLFMALLMFHIWGHLKILIHDLEEFPRPINDTAEVCGKYSIEELQNVRQKLKFIVEHHNQIIKFIRVVSEAFGPVIAASYACYQVTGCIFLFQCSLQGLESLIRFGPMGVVVLSLLVQMSCMFELIGSMRDHLINAVYGLPWECMDTSNRRSVLIILQLAQRPLGVKAMGMVAVGLNTMVTILKTSISYFAMLKTMKMEG